MELDGRIYQCSQHPLQMFGNHSHPKIEFISIFWDLLSCLQLDSSLKCWEDWACCFGLIRSKISLITALLLTYLSTSWKEEAHMRTIFTLQFPIELKWGIDRSISLFAEAYKRTDQFPINSPLWIVSKCMWFISVKKWKIDTLSCWKYSNSNNIQNELNSANHQRRKW